jgi:uncharacterized protein YeeX (DUF496 family)
MKNNTNNLKKTKLIIDTLKWFISFLIIGYFGYVIKSQLEERTLGLEEMKAFDKYTETVLKANNIEERWKLCEFYSLVTPTERLRIRWEMYRKHIQHDYKEYVALKKLEQYLQDSLSQSNNQLKRIKQKLKPYEKRLDGTSFEENPVSITNSNLEENLRRFNSLQQKTKNSYPFNIRLGEFGKKLEETNIEVINRLLNDLEGPYVKTGINVKKLGAPNGIYWLDSAYVDQTGIKSKYYKEKAIIPKLYAKYSVDRITITLSDSTSTETFQTAADDIKWIRIKEFIRNFYLNRLNQLE